jgi:hypothetical protein
MQRFVTGIYSQGHPLAFMTGILVDSWDECVAPLRVSLQQPHISDMLNMCATGKKLRTPSLFPSNAEFDTEHTRDRKKAPAHGTFRIAHMFLPFGYASPARAGRKVRKKALDE